jgi:ATP-dependent RNA helicase DDX27
LQAYRDRKNKRSAKEELSGSEGEDEQEDSDDEEDGDEDMSGEEGSSDGEGFGAGVEVGVEESAAEDGDEDDEDVDMDLSEGDDDDELVGEGSDGESASEVEDTPAEAARKDAFFAVDPTIDPTVPTSFASMNLSRPLLRALTSLSLNVPTPIQARAIPLALLGRDILGSAVTGSGKTAAFMVPILERLCYRDRGKGGQACRVLVLCPTRELAVQCEAVGRALAEKGGMDVRFALRPSAYAAYSSRRPDRHSRSPHRSS